MKKGILLSIGLLAIGLLFIFLLSMSVKADLPFVLVNDDYGPSTYGWGTLTFSNISCGIEHVTINGVVYVYPGTYDGFYLHKQCKVVGAGKDNVIIDGNESGNVIIVNASNSMLMNLNITGVDSSIDTSWGIESMFNNTETNSVCICALDSSHIAVAYRNDIGGSLYGTVRIASVSGNTPTWGSESVFNIGNVYYISICALDSSHIAVAYRDNVNNDYGTVRIASVSGTTPSWGSESVFNSGRTDYPSICALDSSHIAVSYDDYPVGEHGTVRIASVSGTTPSWGSESVFSGFVRLSSICALDSSHIAVAYQNRTSEVGTVRIASVSGTTPTWGSESIFNNAHTQFSSACALDSSHIAVFYSNYGNNEYGTVSIASVSGITPSWGSENVFNSDPSYTSICALDSSHIAIAYRDDGNNHATIRIALISDINSAWINEKVLNNVKTGNTGVCALNETHIAAAYGDNIDVSSRGNVRIGNLGESKYNLMIVNNTANSNTIQNCYFQYVPYSDGGKVSLVGNGNEILDSAGITVLLCNSSNNHIHNNTGFWCMFFTDSNNNTIEHNSPASYDSGTRLYIDFCSNGGFSSNNIVKYNECNRIQLESFSNGYILSNICHNSTYGIFLNGSDNVIYGNILENCNYGVYIE